MAARRPAKKNALTDFEPIPPDLAYRLTAPLRTYFSPRFYGLRNVSASRPTLLVGNHTIYGMLDPVLMGVEIYKRRGVFLRGLADHLHFAVPLWRDLLRQLGAVDGTRENCRDLMRSGQTVLVFPGGGREVAKRRGEQYTLVWKERTGFVRLAIEHGYTITPFASVGPDDAYTILIDADDVMRTPLWRLLKRSRLAHDLLRDGDSIMPIARGLGLSPFPRPERFYFSFGKPIDTTAYAGGHRSHKVLFEVRSLVEHAVEGQIAKLLRARRRDHDQGTLRRLLTRFG